MARLVLRRWIVVMLAIVLFSPAVLPARAQAPVTVRFGVDQFIFGSLVLIADENGIFKKYGITPVI